MDGTCHGVVTEDYQLSERCASPQPHVGIVLYIIPLNHHSQDYRKTLYLHHV